MKKRFIALLLCCVMIFTLSPSLIAAASADDIDGTTQSTEEQETIGENTDTSSTETSDSNPTDTETSTGSQPDATPSNPTGDNTSDSNPAGNTSDGAENNGSSEAKSKTDFASMTDAELYAYVKKLSTDEEIEAFLKQLPEERVNALIAYAQAQEPTVVPETVVFTDAGPFMPPVNVAMKKKLLLKKSNTTSEEPEEPADNGLKLSKTATANDDGSYTIRMEAYTTGKVITSTKTVPVDIVLVLDQSGSMSYDFNGNSTNTNSARRQYAMKRAVNNFIDEVAKKYTPDADHRMAIVTFGSKASTLQGWTYVNPTIVDPDDTTGKTTLQTAISGLPDSPSGATNVAAGMEQAETLMGSGYNYNGTNTSRQKVVIVFTDGVPTTNTDFDTTVATNAIASAKRLKDGKATVYTVGIFNGADPTQLHGDKFDRHLVKDNPCNGNVGEYWGYTNILAWTSGGEAETIRGLDIAATNRFLNFLSSNFKDATNIGIEEYSSGLLGGQAWRITQNFTRTDSSYYLTANDSTSLNSIFQTISDNIQAANIDLGSKTVVKDTVSPYFDLPANTSDIKLYTAAAKADGTFEADVPASGITATIENNAVTVTGFDFNANFVSDSAKSDGSYGKKLIIEFTVTPKDGFIGGNDVPTNDWTKTAVYDENGTEVEKFADETTTPTVNVPIDDVTVTAADKNVYLLGDLTAAQLKEGAVVKCGDVTLSLAPGATNYGLEAWQTAYVDITVEIKDANDNVVSTDLTGLTADTTYTVSVTVTPKSDGTGASGEAAEAKTGANSPAAKINVFKPELTFKDSEVYYGDGVPSDFSGNKTSEVWKHNTTISTGEGVVMTGEKPTLTLTYTPEAGKIDASNKINTKQDIAVDVAVKIDGTNVTGHTTFNHTACNPACGWNKTTLDGSPAFLLHVKTCQLTITKTDGTDGEPYVFTVKKDGKKYTEVTIVGSDSETIYELPVGTYTVAEDTGWSWRYPNPTYTPINGVKLSAESDSGTITCTNSLSKRYWLNGFSNVEKNIFGVKH